MALVLAIVPAARIAGGGFCALGLFLAFTTLRKGRNRGGGGRELAVAGAVLGCLAAAGVLASLAAFGSVMKRETVVPQNVQARPALSASEITKRVLDKELDVEIGSFSLGLEGTGLMQSSLTIHVTNKTNTTRTFEITLEAIGPKGHKLTEDTASVINLGGKQVANVAVFNLVNNELAEQLKQAEFKVTEAVSYAS
jgi:hypothetical protein